tara:strand:+ start:21913 stop:22248 length:336 start_codon:yes stop_codon:yes gene_type:complete
MLESIRQLYYNSIWKKMHLIKLKSIIGNEIIESWRIQKYEIIINKINKNNNSYINNINNINNLLNLIKYNYLFNKYLININLFVILLNNITNIFHSYNIQIDELIEYIICK